VLNVGNQLAINMSNINFGIYENNPEARTRIKGWIAKAEKPMNKYNAALIQAIEEWTGNQASDYRLGSDTETEQEKIIDY